MTFLVIALCGTAGVILFEKWKVDNYMNTHPTFYRYWPKTCELCRAFWFSTLAYCIVVIWPTFVYFLAPISFIPIQVFIQKHINKPTNDDITIK